MLHQQDEVFHPCNKSWVKYFPNRVGPFTDMIDLSVSDIPVIYVVFQQELLAQIIAECNHV